MRTILKAAVVTGILLALAFPAVLRAAEDDIALAIIYDTSGSMKESVPDANGRPAPKYVIANRALMSVSRQLQKAATNGPSGKQRRIDVALFTFHGDGGREVVKLGPLDVAALENWAMHFNNPRGHTPLGNTLAQAASRVLMSSLPRKHVLVITDGINTIGPKPQTVMLRLNQRAAAKGTKLFIHFVAFDVNAHQFDAVKNQGGTVVGAADEKQLNSQLDYLLQQKILLEEEEPPKTH